MGNRRCIIFATTANRSTGRLLQLTICIRTLCDTVYNTLSYEIQQMIFGYINSDKYAQLGKDLIDKPRNAIAGSICGNSPRER